MIANIQPCLSVVSPEIFPTQSPVESSKQLTKQKEKTFIRTLEFSAKFQNEDPLQFTTLIAHALRSMPNLRAIKFVACDIADLLVLDIAVSQHQLPLALEFSDCNIGMRASQSLQFLLGSSSIDGLAFRDCEFDELSATALGKGLSNADCLASFEFLRSKDCDDPYDAKIFGGPMDSPNLSQNLFRLVLSLPNESHFWECFRNFNSNSQLKTLQFFNTYLGPQQVDCLLVRCQLIESLRELVLDCCRFAARSFNTLIAFFSRFKVLDTLILDSIDDEVHYEHWIFGVCNYSRLQLDKLVIRRNSKFFSYDEDFAQNQHIRHLDVGCDDIDENYNFTASNAIVSFCSSLLRKDKGPSEITIHRLDDPHSIDELFGPLHTNTRLQALTISFISEHCLVPLARALSSVSSLRKIKLSFRPPLANILRLFFQELQNSLEINKILHTVVIQGINEYCDAAIPFLPNIRRILAMNRVDYFIKSGVTVGFWPLILANFNLDAGGTYFILREMPDLITPRRKRKTSG